jgi:hypothetical protein
VGSTKHHYTPRYYLRRFESAEGKIWRRDVETGAVVTGNHNHFGYKNHWNRLRSPPPGYEPDWAEKRIAEIDGLASVTVKKLVEGEFPENIRPLVCAIGFMKMHQPRLQRELELEHPEITASWSPDFKLVASISAAIDEGKRLEPLGYSILRIEDDKGMRFLTSSNPLVDFDNKPTKFFPISNRDCLLLTYNPMLARFPPRFMAVTADMVQGINEIALRNSWQYVYSCRGDFDP